MLNKYRVSFLKPLGAGTSEVSENANLALEILYSALKFGKIDYQSPSLQFKCYTPFVFKKGFDYQEVLNTKIGKTFENKDRGFAMAGDDVIFIINKESPNIYDWRRDLDDYVSFKPNPDNPYGYEKFEIIYGKATRSHSKKYQPFGIDKLGNPGDGIEGIKIFKQ